MQEELYSKLSKGGNDMKILLSAESTIDTPVELLEQWGVSTIHFHLERDGESFRDDAYPVSKLFEYTDKTNKMCHTSAPNVQEYEDYFKSIMNDDVCVLHFTISSKLSSSYSNACFASQGNPRIKVIDTKCTSGAIALLVLYAKDLIEAGYSFDEVYSKVLARRDFASTSFIIKDLKYLYKGGRCCGLGYYATKLLKIRPVIQTVEDGSFKMGKTYRGEMDKCILRYIRDRLDSFPLLDTKRCFVNISTCDEDTIEKAKKICKDYGFEEIYFGVASPVNSYHAGPGVLGVHFLYDGKQNIISK